MYTIGQSGQYFVKYGVESWLGGSEDDAWRVQIEGVILHASDGSDEGEVCGRIRSHILLAENRMDAEEFDLDAWADVEELDDIAKAVFTPTGAWSDAVRSLWDDINSLDVFVIEEIFLEKKFRGQDLALAIAERTLSIFGRGCGLVAICPWPSEVEVHGDEDEARVAHRKIGEHSERLGFRALPGTDLWVRSLEHAMTRNNN